MRYEVRFANGYWRVFDTFYYSTYSLCGTQAEAIAACDSKNSTRREGFQGVTR